MYLVPEEVKLKDVIAVSYGSGLGIAPETDAEIGGRDSVVVVNYDRF